MSLSFILLICDCSLLSLSLSVTSNNSFSIKLMELTTLALREIEFKPYSANHGH